MVVTRFAPSPTGYLHIGGLRTALFSYLLAKKEGGKFILRVEDTDVKRNNSDAIRAILEAFEWVGLSYDEIYYQSKRGDIYKEYIDKLLKENKAYKCYMSKEELEELRESQKRDKLRPKYDNRYRDFKGTIPKEVEPVIRIKAPLSGKIEFEDGVKGKLSFNVEDILDDFVIARADGTPTYNFVVAVDDALMGVSDVIRGDDHVSNTPKQIVIYTALGFDLPNFHHIPMIHNKDGKKLSKRDGATDVMEYKKEGYLPHSLLNFLIRLGFSSGDKEIFSKDEMKGLFSVKGINRSASIYNIDKLNWLNSHYISSGDNSFLKEVLGDIDYGSVEVDMLLNLTKQRAKTINELKDSITSIVNRPSSYDSKGVKKHFKDENRELLKLFLDALKGSSDEDYDALIKGVIEQKEVGMAKLAQPIRLSLVGSCVSPSVADVIKVVGKNEAILRVEKLLKEPQGES